MCLCTFASWSCLAALCTNKEKCVRYSCLFLVSCGNVRCAGDAKGDLDVCFCLGAGAGELELLDFAIYTSKLPRVPLSLEQEGEAPTIIQSVRYQRYPSNTRDNLDATSTGTHFVNRIVLVRDPALAVTRTERAVVSVV